MIEKLIGVLLGYWLGKYVTAAEDWLSHASPTGPTIGPDPVNYVPRRGRGPTIPQGGTPSNMPPGAIPVISPSAASHPTVMPLNLPPFPGPGWTFSKTNDAIVQRAWALLPTLALGAYKLETSPTDPQKWLAYRKEKHAQGKTGVTVYTPRSSAPAQQPYPVTRVNT